ncbi:hypothetical protein K523DRAFT_323111 [Schizophyllum commune Tattone D]|nr:hypothetical protein K523DRAFT_323111 [Schizophyllum commune Tattone D]
MAALTRMACKNAAEITHRLRSTPHGPLLKFTLRRRSCSLLISTPLQTTAYVPQACIDRMPCLP